MGIVKSALVFGAGYVIGARAGVQRYQQIKSRAGALLQRPQVRQAPQQVLSAITARGRTALGRSGTPDASSTGHRPPTTPTPPATTPDPDAVVSVDALTDAELEALTRPDDAR